MTQIVPFPDPAPAPLPAEAGAPPDGLIADALRGLRRRHLLVGAVALLGLLATAAVVLLQTPRWQAEATIRLNDRETKTDRLQSATEKLLTGGLSDVAVVRTEVEVLRSRALVRQVFDEMGMAARRDPDPPLVDLIARARATLAGFVPALAAPSDPVDADPGDPAVAADRALRAMERRLSVEAVGNSFLIRVAYWDRDPLLAAAVVNRLVEIYADQQRRAKEGAAETGNEWLQSQLEGLQRAVSESELAVARFRETNRLTDFGNGTILTQQIADVNRSLSELATRIGQARTEAAELQRARTDPTGALASERLLSSPIIQRLLEEDSQLQSQQTEKSITLDVRHPVMRDLQARRENLLIRLRREVDAVAAASARTLQGLQAQETTLRERLRTLLEAQTGQSDAMAKLANLQQVADANRKMYNDFLVEFRAMSARERQQGADIRLITPAAVPTEGSSGRALVAVAGTVASVGFAVAVALLIHWTRSGVSDPRVLERRAGVPALGLVPELPARRRRRFLAGRDAVDPALSDALHGIWHLLLAPQGMGRRQVLLVTSSVPEEGKSFGAVALARTMAACGRRTMLIDLDCRKPSVEALVREDTGVRMDLAIETGTVSHPFTLARSRSGSLDYLVPVSAVADPGALFRSAELHRFVAAARQRYDVVVIDGAPVLATSDPLALARLADATLFVVRWERTPVSAVLNALAALRKSGAPIDGFVLSRVDMPRHARYGYQDRGAGLYRYAARRA